MKALSTRSIVLLSGAGLLLAACSNSKSESGTSKQDRQQEAISTAPREERGPVAGPEAQQMKPLAAEVKNSSSRSPGPNRPSEVMDTTGKRISAEGEFIAAPGVTLRGEAELKEVAGGVQIEVDVKDAPAGAKGIHIHQKGDCSNIPGKSMGDHLTLTQGEQHGLPSAPEHHAGDMGNIAIDADGKGTLTFVVPAVHLEGDDALSLAHRAIVIHEKQDVGSGPTGESGKPIACAVILPSA